MPQTFETLMTGWGLKDNYKQLFDWLDLDGDGRISYLDLKASIGEYITPMESFIFR